MSYTIKYTSDGSNDLTEILGWYKSLTTPDLQRRFIEDLSKALKSLQASPKSFSVRLKNVRCCTLKKFPYNIYYGVDDVGKNIYIVAILHQSRNPKAWRHRL